VLNLKFFSIKAYFIIFLRAKMVKHLPDPTRTRGVCTRPNQYPQVRVVSGESASTGIHAGLNCLSLHPSDCSPYGLSESSVTVTVDWFIVINKYYAK